MGALPGDTVRARVEKSKKSYAEARTLEVVAGPDEGTAGDGDGGRVLRFAPSAELPPNTTFEVTVAAGVPEPFAHLLASFGRAVREGWLDVTTPYVAELSGREPTPVADFLAAHRTELLAAS